MTHAPVYNIPYLSGTWHVVVQEKKPRLLDMLVIVSSNASRDTCWLCSSEVVANKPQGWMGEVKKTLGHDDDNTYPETFAVMIYSPASRFDHARTQI